MKKKRVLIAAAVIMLLLTFSASASAVRHGDVDGNGKTEAADARLALRIAVGLSNSGVRRYHPEAADVTDAFGTTDAADARMILRAAVGLEDLSGAHAEKKLAAEAPACTRTGLTEGAVCAICGEVLVPQTVIPAAGHRWDDGTVTRPASCTSEGERAFTCTVCGAKRTEPTEKTPHTPALLAALEATCTTDGLTAGERCAVCGEILVPQAPVEKLPHTPETVPGKAATCTETGLTDGSVCAVCGETLTAQTVIPAAGHLWDEGTATKPASCTAEGERTFTCTVCGAKRTETIEKTPHTPAPLAAVEATCTTDGLTAGERCAVCGEILIPQEPVPAGHVFSAADDPTAKIVCARCGKELPSFNDLVNALKTELHYYTGFTKTESGGALISSRFSPASLGRQLKEELEKSLFEAGVEYGDRVSFPKLINDHAFPVADLSYVSGLRAGDITGLTVETQPRPDFLASLPDAIETKKGDATVREDLTAIKSADVGEVVKISVAVRRETLTQLKSGGESALRRITDLDLPALAARTEMSETEDLDIGRISMTLSCEEIVSDCVVTYYFTSDTLLPVAAVYDTDTEMTENTEIKLKDKLFGATLASGTVRYAVRNDTTRYCFFDGHFPVG